MPATLFHLAPIGVVAARERLAAAMRLPASDLAAGLEYRLAVADAALAERESLLRVRRLTEPTTN